MSRIKVSFKMPLKIIENKLIGDTISFYVTYYKNSILYELPHHETLQNEKTLVSDSIKYEYFICDLHNEYGFLLKDIKDPLNYRLRKDSLLKFRAFNGGDGNVINIMEIKTKSIEKIYSFRGKEIFKYISLSPQMEDSMYLICDRKMTDIPFSWSTKIDTLYHTKFTEFIIFLKHDSIKNNDFKSHEFYANRFEIRRDTDQDVSSKKDLFERYHVQILGAQRN